MAGAALEQVLPNLCGSSSIVASAGAPNLARKKFKKRTGFGSHPE
jgi:hypothetical protein